LVIIGSIRGKWSAIQIEIEIEIGIDIGIEIELDSGTSGAA